jgi:heptosyltransferase-2
MTEYRIDCRHFVGEKPCNRKCEGGCQHFEPFGTKILIIKLGATGDVLRTTPILRALKERYPQSHITWLVEAITAPLLRSNAYIDRLLVPSLDSHSRLCVERFDLMYNLDKVDLATSLAAQVKAKQKFGFVMSEYGTLTTLNPQASYALQLGVSDEIKFRQNQKSYQQIIFEAVGLPFKGEEYVLELEDEAKAAAELFRIHHGLNGQKVIGLNTGAGNGFAGKAWPIERWAEFARCTATELNAKVLLLGGPDQQMRNEEIERQSFGLAINTGGDHTLPNFSALVNLCDAVVTGDTSAMHIAIALHKPVVVLFGSTCPQEIDLYAGGEKVVAQVDCAPCYLKRCPIGEICMNSIQVDEVFQALRRQLKVSA